MVQRTSTIDFAKLQQGFVDLSMNKIRHANTIPRNTPVSRDLWIHRMVPSASTVRKFKLMNRVTLALTITDTLG